jgi:putative transposase
MIEPDHPRLSLVHQCELVGLARSSYYSEPGSESQENLEQMRLIDQQYTETPFYGSRRMTAWLRREGHRVNRKRVQRLMRQMGIEAIYPKPRLSHGAAEHRVYPYLLRGMIIDHPQQVWSTDITYIRLRAGFVYLVAILDWYSRYVISWELSNSLELSFCLEALDRALLQAQPEIFNSDQGVQFTSPLFTGRLEAAGVRVSMDGRGRVFDNIFVERLWRTVKYEEVYLHDYDSLRTARQELDRYFQYYNQQRGHQSLSYRTPAAVYFAG